MPATRKGGAYPNANHGRYCQTCGRLQGDGLQGAERRARHQRRAAQDHPGHGGGPGLYPGPAGSGAHPLRLYPEHGICQARGLWHRHHHRLPPDGGALRLRGQGGAADAGAPEGDALRRLHAAGGVSGGAVPGPDAAGPLDERIPPQPHPGGPLRQPDPGQPHRRHPGHRQQRGHRPGGGGPVRHGSPENRLPERGAVPIISPRRWTPICPGCWPRGSRPSCAAATCWPTPS